MSETNDVNDAIKHFPRLRARTLRFGCGAPRSAQTVGDGSRALFLRSDGPEDLVTALWLSWFDESGEHHETKLADPRELLGATADSEDVPAEEKARRERAREGGTGIVGYSADDDGNRIVFTINGRLFLTGIDWNDETGAPEPHTRELAGEWLDEDPAMYTPVLNPRIAPDGEHVLYTTGSYLMLVDIGGELGDRITAVYGVSVEDEDGNPAENTWKIGLAEFVTGEDSVAEFTLGEAVFYQNGTWAYNDCINGGMTDEQLDMLPIYIGAEGEENQGLCTGSENFWCVNKKAPQENIDATLAFLKWVVTSDEGRDALANQMGFVTPFKAFDDGYTAHNALLDAAARYIAEGKTSVSWNFPTMPSETWKNNVGAALLEYAQGTGTWDNVKTAFVDGWASEYAALAK